MEHRSTRDPPKSAAGKRQPLSLRCRCGPRAGLVLVGLVVYVLLGRPGDHGTAGRSRWPWSRNWNAPTALEELLVQVNMVRARAILTVNENYIGIPPEDAVLRRIEVDAVLAT